MNNQKLEKHFCGKCGKETKEMQSDLYSPYRENNNSPEENLYPFMEVCDCGHKSYKKEKRKLIPKEWGSVKYTQGNGVIGTRIKYP